MHKRSIIGTGEKVAIGQMLAEDQPHFHRWLSENPELRALIDDPRIPTMDDQRAWFERVQQLDRRMFSILTLPDQKLIGNGGFVDIDPALHTAAFRITIGDPAALGKGYGSEATRLMLEYGFTQMHLAHIRLNVLKSNERAIRTYEKVGFTPVVDSRLSQKLDTLTMDLDYDRFRKAAGCS